MTQILALHSTNYKQDVGAVSRTCWGHLTSSIRGVSDMTDSPLSIAPVPPQGGPTQQPQLRNVEFRCLGDDLLSIFALFVLMENMA